MSRKSGPDATAEKHVKDIERRPRRRFCAGEKIRIELEGLRGECSIAEPRRREGIAKGLYDTWSKKFPEAGKRRLSDDTERQAATGLVREPRRQNVRRQRLGSLTAAE